MTGARPHRRILILAVPAVATLLADPVMGLVDTAVVGRIGAAELGGLGLAAAVVASVSWIFNFLMLGTTSAVARAVGAGDSTAAGRHVVHAAKGAAVLGVMVGGVLLVGAPWLLRALGAVEELLDPGTTYLQVRALGLPFLLLGFVGHGAFRGVTDTRTPLGVVVGANVVNAALTVVLVFPLGLGIAGAAWATVVAEVLTVLALAVLLRRTTGLPLSGHGWPDRVQLGALLIVSRDLLLRAGGIALGLLAITVAAARTGAVTAAAHQVIFQTFLLVSFAMEGFSVAAQALVGTALGAGDEGEARTICRDVVRWGIAGGAVIALLLFAGSSLLPRLLTDDPAVLAAVAKAWWLAALGSLVYGPTFVLDGVLKGAGDFAYLRTFTLLAGAVGGIGGQLAAATGGGVLGLWVAVQAMMLVRLVSFSLRVRGSAWTRVEPGLAPG